MTVLVLGGTGFIGSPLARELRLRGQAVVTVSRSSNSDLPVDLAHVEEQDLVEILDSTQARVVVNLVGAGLSAGAADHESMTRLNSRLPALLCSALSRSSGVRLIHTASSTETPFADRVYESIYSETKALGTNTVLRSNSEGSTSGSILRLHNVYGPTQPHPRFIRMLFDRARSLEDTHLNYPERVRDFVYLDDVVDALSLIVADPSAPAEIEIGTGKGVRLQDAAMSIYGMCDAPSELITWDIGSEDHFNERVAEHPTVYLHEPRTFEAGVVTMVHDMFGRS